MINLAIKFEILHEHFVEGKPVKQISRELGVSRNTVRGYLREFSEQKAELIAGGDRSALLLAMSEEPKYDSQKRERRVLTEQVYEIIQQCLMENERKKELGNGKLCMKSIDIHELLLEKGFTISYPSVNNAVNELRNVRKEAFVKQEYRYGEVCEFDWGEVKLWIDSRLITFRMAVFTLAASNIRYAILYRHEDTQAFLDAHIQFFHFLGRVPLTMVYDNMRVAVAKFVGKTEKIATIALKQLSTYYGFAFRFCNIRKGNEKGHVERSVEVVRRRAFSSISRFATQKEAIQRLNETILRLNMDKSAELQLERDAMSPGMPDYTSVIRFSGMVDKLSTITYKQNHYSVPDYLVGRQVEILAMIDEIVVRYGSNEIARHQRSYDNHTYTLEIMHYRDTLLRKPGALAGSVCMQQTDTFLKILFDKYFKTSPKEFILLLHIMDRFSLHQIHKSIEALESVGAAISFDSVRMILESRDKLQPCTEIGTVDPIEAACEMQLRKWVVA